MNTILLLPEDAQGDGLYRLTGRRAEHLNGVLKVRLGQCLSVGELNGLLGTACVEQINPQWVDIRVVSLTQPPPPTLPATLVLGLPRPRMLQRSLQTLATLGVETLCLIHTERVEKSFWQTPLLQPEALFEQGVLGLEQGVATQLPQIHCCRTWKAFLQDWLPAQLPQHPHKRLAHPGPYPAASPLPAGKALIAIGPEGGFVSHEVQALSDAGFQKMALGPRILRVETAIPVVLAKLFN